MAFDLTEQLPYDLTSETITSTFEASDIAYDVVFDNLPFIVDVNNQNPYRRETAPYRKEQFDNSKDPGEQSLTGWWLRSQTSWHNGAGITFFEPGLNAENIDHRFFDSRGIDVWTVGEASLHSEVFEGYLDTATDVNATFANDGTKDCLVAGNSNGVLRKIALNGNAAAPNSNYVRTGTSFLDGHSGANFPISSVTTDGSRYYSVCSRGIHRGDVSTANSDVFYFKHSLADRNNVIVKYAKGNVFVGVGRVFGLLSTTAVATVSTHTTGAEGTFTNFFSHINPNWNWLDAVSSPGPLYFAGNSASNGEIWAATTSRDVAVVGVSLSESVMVLSLPEGEKITAINYYLGYLAVGTSKGVRICPINVEGNLVMGPLLFETDYAINNFTQQGTYLYAATKVRNGSFEHAVLVRISLEDRFSDNTFAYAYDLEYQSSLNLVPSNSDTAEVYLLEGRLVMLAKNTTLANVITNRLLIKHTVTKRSQGWLETGKIRYGTIEPKFFRYINLQCRTGVGDNITITTIPRTGAEAILAEVNQGLSNQDIIMSTLLAKQEHISLRFTFNNSNEDQGLPTLEAYQLKSIPATRRQRLYQFPLACYNYEMDRFNSTYGYDGRAMEMITSFEIMEETGKFITVTDYRTNEEFSAVVEEVKFTNESSPDKNNSGFGGVLLVTVRKM